MKLLVRTFGRRNYAETWQAMKTFTAERGRSSSDQLWLLEHQPVYTLGVSGRREHVLNPGAVPVVQSDRGGQVTYHGPGQLIAYVLLDLRRAGIGIKSLVNGLEQSVIELLADYSIAGQRRNGAPGVYVQDAKIAALGLRVRRGCSYHGLAINVDMDLTPFDGINPCGYPGLQVTQMHDLCQRADLASVAGSLAQIIERQLVQMTVPLNPPSADQSVPEQAL